MSPEGQTLGFGISRSALSSVWIMSAMLAPHQVAKVEAKVSATMKAQCSRQCLLSQVARSLRSKPQYATAAAAKPIADNTAT